MEYLPGQRPYGKTILTMRTFFLLCAFCCCSTYAQAQFNDSLPWFKAELLVFELEKVIGPMSPDQTTSLTNTISSLRSQAATTSPGKKGNMKQQMRKSIMGILTPEQRNDLKAIKMRPNRDGLDVVLAKARKGS